MESIRRKSEKEEKRFNSEDDTDGVLSGKILAQIVDQDKRLSRIVTHANIVNAAKEAKRDVDKMINETEKILFTTSRG